MFMNSNESTKIRANANVVFDDAYVLKGVKVAETDKGLRVFMPSESYEKEGERQFKEIFHPITKEAQKELKEAVLTKYEAELQKVAAADKSAQPQFAENTNALDFSGPEGPEPD